MLRREPEPDDELVAALFVEAAPRMTCPICKEKTLCAHRPTDDRRRRRLAGGRAVRNLPRAD